MKYLLCLILLSPFLVCDPQAGVDSYQVTGLPGITTIQAQVDGSIKADLASIAPGSYSINVQACQGVWCSDPAPFDFSRPSLKAATGIKLSK